MTIGAGSAGGGSVSVGGGSVSAGGSSTAGGGSASAGTGAGGSIATGAGLGVEGEGDYTDLDGFKEEHITDYGDLDVYDAYGGLDYGDKDIEELPAVTDQDYGQVKNNGRTYWQRHDLEDEEDSMMRVKKRRGPNYVFMFLCVWCVGRRSSRREGTEGRACCY